jgi:hypothetical protein
MASAVVSDIAQTVPQFSNTLSNSSPQEERGAGSPGVSAALTKDDRLAPNDTISISDQSRQAVVDGKKAEAKKERTPTADNSGKSGTITATIQFVYDLKGELIVRHMDSANRLIYQIPSRLALLIRELASKSYSSVDTKA